ncbi:hypothetical protein NJB1907f44_06120 [Mycobacterium marinum]|uniref:Uncharacterized protein n=2 Tax=Mycobacterium ulcerans group TaxID=2993898 RepID=A0A9N7LJT2_9MYCO|nr:hypothetical protein MMSP_5215 [Mycobacterium sp. 012931]EPQ71602.1 hypothetical protein MMMB2_5436 [Mycobacterium marinum MB2]BBX57238.1 hypothetical protein MSHO_25830 [Mycobacterium shottsii]BDN80730.1 hypothetical protein NJB1907Z4_C09450 [Mycobacterium pseudoshottsii]GJO00240.1 hypothetical protein NJB1907E90_02030 [Mycobacterium marinum]
MLTIDLKAHHSGVAIALVDAFGSGDGSDSRDGAPHRNGGTHERPAVDS